MKVHNEAAAPRALLAGLSVVLCFLWGGGVVGVAGVDKGCVFRRTSPRAKRLLRLVTKCFKDSCRVIGTEVGAHE